MGTQFTKVRYAQGHCCTRLVDTRGGPACALAVRLGVAENFCPAPPALALVVGGELYPADEGESEKSFTEGVVPG